MRLLTKQQFKQYNPKGKEDLDKWRQIFVETGDPTEYEAALQLVGSWAAWQKFKKDWPFFKNQILPEWLTELEIRLRSKAIRKMVASADDDLNTAAMRWIAEGKYKPDDKRTAAVKRQEQAIKKGVATEIDEDVRRVSEANVVKLERNT